MRLFDVFFTQFRGVRVVNLLGGVVLLVIVLASYGVKTLVGAQDAGAADVETQIVQEQKRIRMLRAEVSSLGAPKRVADLSRTYLPLGPVAPGHDITVDALPALAARPAPTAQDGAASATANRVTTP